MPVFRIVAAALLALLPLLPGSAFAARTINLTGTFDGSLAGQGFTGQSLTFTGVTTGDVAEEVFDEFHYALASLTVSYGGASYTVDEPAMFFVAPLSALAGFADPDAAKGLVRFDYTQNNAVFTDAQTQAFATSGGALLIGAGSGLALTGVALPGAPGAVPEPASWALLLTGFVMVGGIVRRRRPAPAFA